MNKELETLIQQMAKEANTFHPDSPAHEYNRRGYTQGIKDADAIGFAEWIVKNYSLDADGLRWTELKSDIHYTSGQIYLQYLKTKT